MAAGTFHIFIEQGTTYTQDFIWQTDLAVPINNTGYTARMQVRSAIDAPTYYIELTTENGRIVLGGSNGKITIGLTAVETAALQFTDAVYDLEIVAPSGAVTRLLKGTVSIDPEVTR